MYIPTSTHPVSRMSLTLPLSLVLFRPGALSLSYAVSFINKYKFIMPYLSHVTARNSAGGH